MVKDAEEHADEDKKRRELVDAKNQAEALLHSAQKTLGEHGDKISQADKSAIEAAMADLKSAAEGDDAADIKAKSEALGQASMKLGEAIYKASQEQAGDAGEAADGTSAGGAGGADSDVVDADFEEVEDGEDDENQKSA